MSVCKYLYHRSLPLSIGAPLPPVPNLTATDATHLNLSWDPPFHLDQDKYPILYYEVQVTIASSVEVFEDRQVNGTYEIYNISATAETCHTLSFNVTATTAVGTSSPGEVEGGFPIRELSWRPSKLYSSLYSSLIHATDALYFIAPATVPTPFDTSSLVMKKTDGSIPSLDISFMVWIIGHNNYM